MLFNSFGFIGFFVVVYAGYLILTHRAQNLWLLGASYVFYGLWSRKFLLLMIAVSAFNFVLGLAIHGARTKQKKAVLILGLVANLGMLVAFKYLNFFATGLGHLLEKVGLRADVPTLHLILPLGISFYTFHNISYLVDIYRGRIGPTRSFTSYALYVALFPQLIAGPIARPEHLLPQIEKPRVISYAKVREGFWLILLGFYKKVVLADNLVPFTEPIFSNPSAAAGPEILLAIYAFAFQIYGDFSGYSDIARGLSKLMGFELLLNFERPYFAVNPADFWRRWHISLSTWLRDYLYIPLGGNRKGEARTYRNLLITMLLGGLWHGASLHFIIWGFYHGVLLAVHRAWSGRRALAGRFSHPFWTTKAGRALTIIGFFHLTCLGWLLFAVQGASGAPILLRNLGRAPVSSASAFNALLALATLLLFAAPLMLLEWAEERGDGQPLVRSWPRPLRLVCYLTMFAAIVLCGAVKRNAFIYFQF